jgi:pectate lyase
MENAMTKPIRIVLFLGAMLALFGQAPSAHAQASRTWVSGVGDDVNPCSRTAPCKTFAGAISKTPSGGEINALDPAGYGALTITKPITIDGGGGQVASVLVSGTNGIVVSAGSGNVILRNLRINGIGSGIDGVLFNSGTSLLVDNCDIFGFTNNGVHVHTAAGTKMSSC